MSISRRSRGGDRRPSCSARMRRGGLRPTSPSCRICCRRSDSTLRSKPMPNASLRFLPVDAYVARISRPSIANRQQARATSPCRRGWGYREPSGGNVPPARGTRAICSTWNSTLTAIRASRLQPVSATPHRTMAVFQLSRQLFKRAHEFAHARRGAPGRGEYCKMPDLWKD
jgi:hypothetical protein